jgi:hypothetical protein
MLACARCAHYGYHVSSRIGGRVGDLFTSMDLLVINVKAASHQCPPEVERAAAEVAGSTAEDMKGTDQ